MFGYFGKVDSISRAVTIIGTQQLRDLALAAAVMGVFKDIPEELVNMPSFWRHSIACGIIARSIAVYLRENNVERLFVAGILHDVGQLILFTSVPDRARQLLEQSRHDNELFFVTERKVLGFDHAELGGALLRSWKIPANVSDPVTFHHQPQRAEQFPLEAAIIHLADIVCQGLELGASGEWGVPPLDPKAWDRIGMPVTMLATIIKQAEPIIEETFAILAEDH
jgi:putative nucleotidyltransferase with HDIG domain